MRDRVLELLARVASGEETPAVALERLSLLPIEEVDGGAPEGGPAGQPFARLDHNRALRQGQPEVVFGPGKTLPQLLEIARRLVDRGDGLLVTRLEEPALEALGREFPQGSANTLGRIFHVPAAVISADSATAAGHRVRGTILVVTGGTGDIPVAEEAVVTAGALGNPVDRLYDVGVAGIHRVLSQLDVLRQAAVVIVVAGMEGALPSVVGGLVASPVIAVPTSVGYGASFGGLAPLLGMLNSCAAGITVVNIDNGFGAACAASRINLLREIRPPRGG